MRGAPGLLLLAATACSPVTSRPSFRPGPEAVQVLVVGDPAAVTRHVAAWIAGAGVPIVRTSELDRYVETDWYRPKPDSTAAGPFPFLVKTRIWVDPGGTGRARATIETVYRPTDDPSRAPRDRERAVPADADGLARGLVAAIGEKFQVI